MANIHDPQNNLTSLERVDKANDQSITSILLYLNNGNNQGEVPTSNWDCDTTSLYIYLMHLAFLSITFISCILLFFLLHLVYFDDTIAIMVSCLDGWMDLCLLSKSYLDLTSI